MSDSARISALLCLQTLCLALRGFCWPLLLKCLPAACRQAFPAAAVTVVHASLFADMLELIEASSGGSAAVCVAGIGRQGLKASYCSVGDTFAGRQIRCHRKAIGWIAATSSDVSTLQEMGDCCRRLVSSHSLDVQVSVNIAWYAPPNTCATAVAGLAPHLYGISALPLRLQTLLPAAAQLEHIALIDMDSEDLSLLGQFCMLKELHVYGQHLVQLTAALPQLHTLRLIFHDTSTPWGDGSLQCLLSQVPALRQLVLCLPPRLTEPQDPLGLSRWDMEALVGLQCQQLDLLTVFNSAIDEHTVGLLAHIQCPLKLSIDIDRWHLKGKMPLFSLLARLPNLIALRLEDLDTVSDVISDQSGGFLHHIQRLEVISYSMHQNNSLMSLQSILSMCPALKHLTLHCRPGLSPTAQTELHTRLWHAFKNCAKLVSLKFD